MSDCISVFAVSRPHLFANLSVFLDKCRIQAIGYGRRGIRILLLQLVIESLSLFLSHAVVEMTGRSQQQILAISLIDPFWKYRFIEDYGKQFRAELIDGLPFT